MDYDELEKDGSTDFARYKWSNVEQQNSILITSSVTTSKEFM